ncbi:hypothetical protein GGF50DRAFT_87426 [Schizophyllum commune]
MPPCPGTLNALRQVFAMPGKCIDISLSGPNATEDGQPNVLNASYAKTRAMRLGGQNKYSSSQQMCPPSGLYRYVLIPFSDAARKLRTEFNMQPQTEDDLNGGVLPVTGEAVLPGSDQYPITESPAHPYSVSSYATMEFNFGFIDGTAHTAQTSVAVPRVYWFLDAPKKGANDYEVTGLEKSGYSLGSLMNSLQREPGDLEEILKVSEVDYLELREKVLEWFERDQQPSKLRRSKRIAERMARATSYTSHPNDFKVPEWVQQNGHFPTRELSSNDWAFFYHSTSLEGRISERQSGP